LSLSSNGKIWQGNRLLRLPSEPSLNTFEKLRPIVPNGRNHWQGNSGRAFVRLARCCAEATWREARNAGRQPVAARAKMMIGKEK
jgi:hypothetical protein